MNLNHYFVKQAFNFLFILDYDFKFIIFVKCFIISLLHVF